MRMNKLKAGDKVTFANRSYANIYGRSGTDRGVVTATRVDSLSLDRRPLVSVLFWDNMVEEDIDCAALRAL